MKLQLVRDYAGDDCTLGRIVVGGLTLETLEPAWDAREPEASCVPPGEYALALHDSERFARTFALAGQARSSYILQKASFVDGLTGWSVGRARRFIAERWMVTDAEHALRALLSAVPWVDGHVLTVSYLAGSGPDEQSHR